MSRWLEENGMAVPVVRFEGGGSEAVVLPHLFRSELVGIGISQRLQLPLRAAYAMTIHKSQGMGLSSALVSTRGAFAEGQVYVALSRLRGLEGLSLARKIEATELRTSPLVQRYTHMHAHMGASTRMRAGMHAHTHHADDTTVHTHRCPPSLLPARPPTHTSMPLCDGHAWLWPYVCTDLCELSQGDVWEIDALSFHPPRQIEHGIDDIHTCTHTCVHARAHEGFTAR